MMMMRLTVSGTARRPMPAASPWLLLVPTRTGRRMKVQRGKGHTGVMMVGVVSGCQSRKEREERFSTAAAPFFD